MLLIRPAEMSDLATIVRFNAAMAMETEGVELNEGILVRGVQALLADATRGRYFMAEIDDKIVGQAMVTFEWSDWRNGNWWWFQSVYVLPEWRRKGVFRSLCKEIGREALKAGDAIGLRLYVDAGNRIAQETYEQLGFEESHYRLYETQNLQTAGQE